MNLGLYHRLKSEFTGYTPVERPVILNEMIPDPAWISGFVSGEGNFDVRRPTANNSVGIRVQLRFRIVQLKRDLKLRENILKSLGSGKIYKYNGQEAVSLTIVKFKDLTDIIIPFFL
jgi:LAGLIDADG endonuclease